MIGLMIAPAAPMMLLCRPKFKVLCFQMNVNTRACTHKYRFATLADNLVGDGARFLLTSRRQSVKRPTRLRSTPASFSAFQNMKLGFLRPH